MTALPYRPAPSANNYKQSIRRRPTLTARWVTENGKLTCKWLPTIEPTD